MRRTKGFTLIELLIVVAIIAILAAIAVPNFLEAQTRSKVSRVKSDMRTAATAIESYKVDYNKYPFDGYTYDGSIPNKEYRYWYLPNDLSTPISYLTTVRLVDPFRKQGDVGSGYQDIRYINSRSTWGPAYDEIQNTKQPTGSIYLGDILAEFGGWRINSAGPDYTYGPTGWPGVSDYPANPIPYDPTNGTVSDGDIQRSQKASTNGYVNAQ